MAREWNDVVWNEIKIKVGKTGSRWSEKNATAEMEVAFRQ